MKTDSDGRIDEVLRQAGANWRSGQDEDMEIDPAWFDQPRGAPRFRELIAGASALVIVVALIAVAVTLALGGPTGLVGSATPAASSSSSPVAGASATPASTPSASPSPSTGPSRSAQSFDVVSDGDSVTATGILLESESGRVVLCHSIVSFASGGGAGPGCSSTGSVGVVGLDVQTLPGAQQGTTWVSAYVRVYGTWSAGAIQATSALVTEAPTLTVTKVPCPAPDGGWPGNATTDVQQPKLAELENLIADNPNDYSSDWVGPIDDTADTAVVVGTLGDVHAAFEQLAAIYPYNLCVISVTYSGAELRQIAAQLPASNRSWEAHFDPTIDRVRVTAVVLDQQLADLLTPYSDEVVVETAVVHAP